MLLTLTGQCKLTNIKLAVIGIYASLFTTEITSKKHDSEALHLEVLIYPYQLPPNTDTSSG